MCNMKLLYRITVSLLVTVLFIVTYFAGIPHMFKDWYSIDDTRYHKDKDADIKISRSKEIHQKHAQIDREWNDFYHLSKKAKHQLNFGNFTLKYDSYAKKSTFNLHESQEDRKENSKIGLTNKKVKKERTKQKNQCIILIYTWLHKSREWYNLPIDSTKDYLKRTRCKYQNCLVTYDKGYLHISDVVIFHARNIPSTDALHSISNNYYRPITQRWVYFTSETPKNSAFGSIPYNGLFNWTMTYKADSDIFLPYLQYRKLRHGDPRPNPLINYAENKTQIATWLVGNCNFEFRINFAHLLSQYTDIYVGGGCRDQFKKKITCTRWCDLSALMPYKFYLSFENGICTDYITEKYWLYLEMGLVPVVLGGANYSDPRLAIPGSFIDASKFKSIKALGLYLNYLDKNDTAYSEYFKWRQKYKIWHPLEGDWPFESYFLCKICRMLNMKLPGKVQHRLSEFWNEYTDCELPERRLKDKFIPSNFDSESRHRDSEEERRIKNAQISKDFDEDFA